MDDPKIWSALQGEAKFHRGMQVFLNGTEVILHDLPETGHDALAKIEQTVPDHMQLDIGASDRWQKAWMGLDSSLLKVGENIISVSVRGVPVRQIAAARTRTTSAHTLALTFFFWNSENCHKLLHGRYKAIDGQ